MTEQITGIKRTDERLSDYKELLKTESHHNHEIIEKGGVIRWKENKDIGVFLAQISLNDLCPLLDALGYGKNSEVYRKLYRDMGYSLSGYWEIFYWDMNNDDCDDYEQPYDKSTIDKLIANHQAMQWRSVEDELPEDGQWVLVETFAGEVLIAVHIGKGMWHTYCETDYSVDVVMRWMILPEAIDYEVQRPNLTPTQKDE